MQRVGRVIANVKLSRKSEDENGSHQQQHARGQHGQQVRMAQTFFLEFLERLAPQQPGGEHVSRGDEQDGGDVIRLEIHHRHQVVAQVCDQVVGDQRAQDDHRLGEQRVRQVKHISLLRHLLGPVQVIAEIHQFHLVVGARAEHDRHDQQERSQRQPAQQLARAFLRLSAHPRSPSGSARNPGSSSVWPGAPVAHGQ